MQVGLGPGEQRCRNEGEVVGDLTGGLEAPVIILDFSQRALGSHVKGFQQENTI